MTISDEDVEILDEAEQDPVGWVADALGMDTWSAQSRILKSIRDNRTTAVRSCHSAGKSTTAAAAVLWFVSAFDKAIAITTATTKRQVTGILWREIRRLHRDAKFDLGGKMLTAQWDLTEDCFAWGFTAPEYDADKFQGFHAPYILVVVDEASGVSDTVFEGIDAAMASGHARMLLIGNPTTKDGRFGRAFKSDNVSKISIDAFETPNFTEFGITIEDIRDNTWKEKITGPLPRPYLIGPEWVREKWEDWCGGTVEGEDDPRWQSRVRANFPENDSTAFVPLWWIEAANERWQELEDTDGWSGPADLGVDVARLGANWTVLAVRYAQGIRSITRFPKQELMATVGGVLQFCREHADIAEVRVDADGIGAGVCDFLVEQRSNVFEMHGGLAPIDPQRYLNNRAEWLWTLREALRPDCAAPIALPPDEALTKQLTSIRYKLDGKGHIKIETKDEMRARKMQSPDELDACSMANARLPKTTPFILI